MAKSNGYVDRSAQGLAPLGSPVQGQSAGEPFPGNGRMSIDRSNPNPSDRDMRINALYNTIESRGMAKGDAKQRMMSSLPNSRVTRS